jgi:sulfite reductase alpha subunit-like flavoprotein
LKRYVQHKILEQKELLNELLIEKKGYFLLSGSSKNMPQAVQAALREVLGDELHVDAMLKNGRYQEETWA